MISGLDGTRVVVLQGLGGDDGGLGGGVRGGAGRARVEEIGGEEVVLLKAGHGMERNLLEETRIERIRLGIWLLLFGSLELSRGCGVCFIEGDGERDRGGYVEWYSNGLAATSMSRAWNLTSVRFPPLSPTDSGDIINLFLNLFFYRNNFILFLLEYINTRGQPCHARSCHFKKFIKK